MPRSSANLFITDHEVVTRVSREQRRRRDKTPTKTATKLLTEYFALMDNGILAKPGDEDRRRRGDAAEPSAAR